MKQAIWISLWNATTLEEIRTFPGAEENWTNVALSPNGKVIAGGTKSAIQLWDAVSGQQLHTLVGPSDGLTFAPDGTQIAGGSTTEVIL